MENSSGSLFSLYQAPRRLNTNEDIPTAALPSAKLFFLGLHFILVQPMASRAF